MKRKTLSGSNSLDSSYLWDFFEWNVVATGGIEPPTLGL